MKSARAGGQLPVCSHCEFFGSSCTPRYVVTIDMGDRIVDVDSKVLGIPSCRVSSHSESANPGEYRGFAPIIKRFAVSANTRRTPF
jgi:hypothetical protein